jgi:hemolysin activation/secretion protein/AraC-like DNA-binding protein
MIAARHLILQEMSLRPSGEWTPGGCWTVVRVAEGAGYGLQTGAAREFNAGDMAVAGPNAGVIFRASQLGVLKLEYFQVLPQCLNGLLTVTEWRQLEDASSEVTTRLQYFAANDPAAQKFTRLSAQLPRDGLAARSALLQLWAANVTGLLPAAGANASVSNLRERFRQFVGKMSEAELAVRPLTQLAGELHCSERHFSRLFREEFQVSLRARQTELRLQRARQLLAESDAKIINVAYESGYRHLGLFNAMFKRRFGVTPSQWRQQNLPSSPPPPRRTGLLPLLLLGLFLQIFPASRLPAQNTNAPATGPKATTNTVAHFNVNQYLVSGNTVLAPGQLGRLLTNLPAAFGTNVTFDDIRAALADLQMAYRERGYVTVSVGLPQQRLTNAEVKIKVTEGRLADIKVEGNKYFSTPNVLRSLPSLHSNLLLNSHVFQRELDLANANRNRQIYPTIGPGPDPGTTELTLTVKDRLPWHARVELNDISTPGTPFTRAVFNTEYDNLWQLEHAMGISYNFTPVTFHGKGDFYWWPLDLPLVNNYSVFYRLPLAGAQSVQEQVDTSDGHFGYNEVTHQFQMPPPTGRPELTLYASRSLTDTGVQINNLTNVVNTPLVSIVSYDSGQNVTLNEDVGAKISWPLPRIENVSSTLLFGVDLKHFQQVSYNTNNFVSTELFTNSNGTVTPITANLNSSQPSLRTEVYYVPFNVGINGSIPDPLGTTFFNAQGNFNLNTFNGYSARYAASGTNVSLVATNRSYVRGGLATVAGNPHLDNGYITVQMGLDRVQRLYKDWTVKVHADGQWANGALFSNEQFGMGGISGVRGYQDGFAYGDAGWRVSVEPQTPLIQIGDVDGDTPFWLRFSVFMDYGEVMALDNDYFLGGAYQSGPAAPKTLGTSDVLSFWGAGWSMTMNIGNHIDGRLTMGFPLLNPNGMKGFSPIDDLRIYFAIGGQF